MSPQPGRVTTTDLLAYVDGRVSATQRAAVERHLADHPELVEQVAAWREQSAALSALYGPVADEAVPSRLDPRAVARRLAGKTTGWARMAAAVVLLALGGAGGWLARDLAAPSPLATPLVDEAVLAHRVYSSEVVHPVEVAADRRDHLAVWLSKRLDRALVVPDLREQGLDLVGGRLLPAADGPAAQFMYEDTAGHRITLYILPDATGTETTLRWTDLDRLGAFYWTEGRIRCAIVGDLPRAKLRSIARRAYEQLG